MFSSDKNVETIGQLVEVLKHYIGLRSEYMKLDAADKVVRLLTALIIGSLLLALLAMRMPVAFALGFSGAVGLALLRDFSFATNMLGSIPFDETARFTLTIIPMFILMGAAVASSPAGKDLYEALDRWLYRVPGWTCTASVPVRCSC